MLFLLAYCTHAVLFAAPVVGTTMVLPKVVTAGIPTSIRITAQITDSLLIPASIQLVRRGSATSSPTTIASMTDDGLNGDVTPNDGIYTAQLNLLEVQSGTIGFQVSAAFRGFLTRSTSPVQWITVVPLLTGITDYSNMFYQFSYPSVYNLHISSLVVQPQLNNHGVDLFGLTSLDLAHSSSDAVSLISVESTPNWGNELPTTALTRVYNALSQERLPGDTLEKITIAGYPAVYAFFPWFARSDGARLGTREIIIPTQQRIYDIQMLWSESASNSLSSPVHKDFETIFNSFHIF